MLRSCLCWHLQPCGLAVHHISFMCVTDLYITCAVVMHILTLKPQLCNSAARLSDNTFFQSCNLLQSHGTAVTAQVLPTCSSTVNPADVHSFSARQPTIAQLLSQPVHQSTKRLTDIACDSHVQSCLTFILLILICCVLTPNIMLFRSSEICSRQTSMSL